MLIDAHVSSDGSSVSRSAPPVPPSSPPQLPIAQAAPAQGAVGPAEGSVAPVWLQRLSLVVLVLFCLYLGGMMTILPWWSRVWDRNLFIQSRPALAALLYNGAVRGLISGVGLLDIWIGISEAIHYRDHGR